MLALTTSLAPRAGARTVIMPHARIANLVTRNITTSAVQRPSWSVTWHNLTPKTRRNVKALAALGIAIDSVVFLNYNAIYDWFTGEEKNMVGSDCAERRDGGFQC